ncbi:unnamed protein product [Linum trigynum]
MPRFGMVGVVGDPMSGDILGKLFGDKRERDCSWKPHRHVSFRNETERTSLLRRQAETIREEEEDEARPSRLLLVQESLGMAVWLGSRGQPMIQVLGRVEGLVSTTKKLQGQLTMGL